jgi:hypothetical protein
MGLCKFPDSFINEKVYWAAHLTNGETIYQDDDRPGEEEPKAWLRLHEYVHKNSFAISYITVHFYDHVEQVTPENCDLYYFVQSAVSILYQDKYSPRRTYCYYIFGHSCDLNRPLDGDIEIQTSKWIVPEIIEVERGKRIVDFSDEKLIINFNQITI